MKRFQEWQQNQTYFQHLNNLTKILKRKPTQQKMFRTIRKERDVLHDSQIQLENSRLVKCIQNPGRVHMRQSLSPHVKKQNHQELAARAYENFLFGKRILETEPVISKIKMDREYQLHRKTIKAMTQKKGDSWTRIKKLHEFRSDFDTSMPLRGEGKHTLNLTIKQFELYKQKLSEDDLCQLSLECYIGQKAIKSDMVAAADFLGQHFRFRFKKRMVKEANSIIIFLRYHKGNSDIELGYFTVSTEKYANSQDSVQVFESETKPILKRIGTVTGAIAYDVQFSKLI